MLSALWEFQWRSQGLDGFSEVRDPWVLRTKKLVLMGDSSHSLTTTIPSRCFFLTPGKPPFLTVPSECTAAGAH